MNGCRERHGARSLMARNSTEHLVASTIWSREDPFFSVHGVNTALPSIYKCDIMLVLKGAVFLPEPLYC